MTNRARLNRTGLPAAASTGTKSIPLTEGWELIRASPGEYETPRNLPATPQWKDAAVPGTVAVTVGPASVDAHPAYDESDWWYRCRTPASESGAQGDRWRLRFDGLATLAEVWFNGTRVLTSSNMFLTHEVDVTDLVGPENELTIVFRSLEAELSVRRARPRWKTQLVSQQQLRWFRTTLLGRMPGWTPAIHPVGPWRNVWLERVTGPDLVTLSIRPSFADGHGRVDIDGLVALADADELTGGVLRVGDAEVDVTVEKAGSHWSVRASARIDAPRLWWPGTHGEPHLYPCSLKLSTPDGDFDTECEPIGFRTVEVDQTDGRVSFIVNGTPVFCRGGCWTTNDIVSLVGDPVELRATLRRISESNANMIRVGGTMVYESDAFYRECDRLGLMVWQDFMFANMDYPVEDEDFGEQIRNEATQQLGRLSRHPSVVAYCGGSEIEQQAAMFGAPREVWSNDFFGDALETLVSEHDPGAAYWPSTPTGGALPFHVGEGLAHYYGVGAYRRPLEDVRLARVKFTPECLGFSNVPEPENLRLLEASPAAPHHPDWKKGVPRDSGAGWDFEDVRDHYLHLLHDVDPVRLRSEDPDLYLRLSRTVTGRVMERVFDEWRSTESECGGGLVWFLRDLRPGAGWGILDSEGNPKPVYHFLKRAWAPLRVMILDRGLDGVRIEAHNETRSALTGHLTVRIYSARSKVLAERRRPVEVPARGTLGFSLEDWLSHFADPAYAYRFGPPHHAAIEAVLESSDADDRVSAMFWPSHADALPDAELQATIDGAGHGVVCSTGLARDVRIDLKDGQSTDNYFDLAPDESRHFETRDTEAPDTPPRGFVEAREAPDGTRLQGLK